MTITVTLAPDVARRLEERAADHGQSVESYLALLAEADIDLLRNPVPTMAELDRLLDDLATGPALLPVDWTREDIYAEHD